jgi:HTH-type transcriptional regulator/antitoxin HigA
MKVLKTDADYTAALSELERLIHEDPEPGTQAADRLEVLTLLIEEYESKHFPIGSPDPVTAIRFRMEQQGLSQNDLAPYMGSRSKVSEILSGKRPLSLSMIRALHFGLGIPASALLQEAQQAPRDEDIEWEKFPVKEMMARGWLTKTRDKGEVIKIYLEEFFSRVGPSSAMAAVYLKKDHIRSAKTMDHYALAAWSAWVLMRATEAVNVRKYQPGSINMELLRHIAHLSSIEKGPLRALDFLAEHGIAVIVEPHMPRTFIDGAAMMTLSGTPVIGLTLRHDRIDNFWFVLMHELVHIWRHVLGPNYLFYDDLDSRPNTDRQETEADEVAGEALVPHGVWDRSPAKVLPSPEAAKHLANSLGIHPAIVAGKMRHEANNYKILVKMVGHGDIRNLFLSRAQD